MTKDELQKEAYEWTEKNISIGISMYNPSIEMYCGKAYIESAEPREKEIKSLGERCLQLQKDKGNLTDSVNNLEEKLANADYQLEGRDLEIKELKAQIEKMKCCGNCAKNGHICVAEEMQGKLCGKNKDKWELRS